MISVVGPAWRSEHLDEQAMSEVTEPDSNFAALLTDGQQPNRQPVAETAAYSTENPLRTQNPLRDGPLTSGGLWHLRTWLSLGALLAHAG